MWDDGWKKIKGQNSRLIENLEKISQVKLSSDRGDFGFAY